MSFISKKNLFRARALYAYGFVMITMGILFSGLSVPTALLLIGVVLVVLGYLIRREEDVIAKPYPGESSD